MVKHPHSSKNDKTGETTQNYSIHPRCENRPAGNEPGFAKTVLRRTGHWLVRMGRRVIIYAESMN